VLLEQSPGIIILMNTQLLSWNFLFYNFTAA